MPGTPSFRFGFTSAIDPAVTAWLQLFADDEAPNLYLIGPDEAERDEVVIDVLSALPPIEFARMSYGEVAAAVGREYRLLRTTFSPDQWSEERATTARDTPLLVVDNFGAGQPDRFELFGLMVLFQTRRDDLHPILASGEFSRDEIVRMWEAGADDELLANKSDWRFFRDTAIVALQT